MEQRGIEVETSIPMFDVTPFPVYAVRIEYTFLPTDEI